MNKNILKLLAALTMVIDHAGLLLFPQTAVLRWIGRISFPLFAFCVGDGCVHTRKPWVYFWRVLGLGLACQIVFAAEELLGGGTLRGSQALYLNILFTLALAILLCTSFLRLRGASPTPKMPPCVPPRCWPWPGRICFARPSPPGPVC